VNGFMMRHCATIAIGMPAPMSKICCKQSPSMTDITVYVPEEGLSTWKQISQRYILVKIGWFNVGAEGCSHDGEISSVGRAAVFADRQHIAAPIILERVSWEQQVVLANSCWNRSASLVLAWSEEWNINKNDTKSWGPKISGPRHVSALITQLNFVLELYLRSWQFCSIASAWGTQAGARLTR
jgi:hypothetical protein